MSSPITELCSMPSWLASWRLCRTVSHRVFPFLCRGEFDPKGSGHSKVARTGVLMLLTLGLVSASWAAEESSPIETVPDKTSAAPLRDLFSDTWVATDALGRALPGPVTTGAPKKDRFVGVFYFLWQGHRPAPLFNLEEILKRDPVNPKFGPRGAFHWWGEPALGYYLGTDRYVIRKHAQMLTDAGVDVMVFDTTNGYVYRPVYTAICEEFRAMRADGIRTPQIAFLTSDRGFRDLWKDLYQPQLYSELWFRWKGKPLLMTRDDFPLPTEAEGVFSRRISWAWKTKWYGNGKDRWPWIDDHPQNIGWHESPEIPEQISVSIASHPTRNMGRSYKDRRQPAVTPQGVARASERGLMFRQQWEHALKVDPEFIFITGWNEWIAQRQIAKTDKEANFLGRRMQPGETYFVDAWTPEFSRDAEPMNGLLRDSYYYQMVTGIRRYKGTRTNPIVTRKQIVIGGRFDDWGSVQPEFRDTRFDITHRNHAGWGNVQYKNDTGRNDIATAKVTTDGKTIFFLVQTTNALTPPQDPDWMTLLVDIDADASTGFMGYDFIVNGDDTGNGMRTLRRNIGGRDEWEAVGNVAFGWSKTQLELAIPLRLLNRTELPARLDFKWADNVGTTADWKAFLLNGDVAPNNRFNFRARFR